MHVTLADGSPDAASTTTKALGWWSPDPRAILPLASLRVSRSLRRSMRAFEVSVDRCFSDVVVGCAAPHRPDGWINDEIA